MVELEPSPPECSGSSPTAWAGWWTTESPTHVRGALDRPEQGGPGNRRNITATLLPALITSTAAWVKHGWRPRWPRPVAGGLLQDRGRLDSHGCPGRGPGCPRVPAGSPPALGRPVPGSLSVSVPWARSWPPRPAPWPRVSRTSAAWVASGARSARGLGRHETGRGRFVHRHRRVSGPQAGITAGAWVANSARTVASVGLSHGRVRRKRWPWSPGPPSPEP